ncbi:MAG: gliding motility-associated C-terminal domain-containing protein [Bacteroidales bacterium]|nr:gliding motility-associated C-terminal domain-containing protein [Bacteroidales bacterium]
MRLSSFRIILFFAIIFCCSASALGHQRDSLESKSLEFIANKGQWEKQIIYKAKLNGGAFFAEKDRITFVFLDQKQLSQFYEAKFDPTLQFEGNIDASYYHTQFVGCNSDVIIEGIAEQSHYHNYFLGRNRQHWVNHVPLFKQIKYDNLYNGIDLIYYQKENHLKYEFHIAANANPQQIRLLYDGCNRISLNNGNLIIKTDIGENIELAPVAYQIDDAGDTIPVKCQFLLKKNTVSFAIKDYDHNKTLVIDPELIFSSYSGSTADNWGFTATYDQHGNLFGGGIAFDVGYPVDVPHHYQTDFSGGACDIAISKFDSTGSTLYYSTYIGGSAAECPHSMFVNDNDELYVFGTTGSYTFPTTPNAYDSTFNGGSNITINGTIAYPHGSDIFVCKFSADGDNLLASSFIGGSYNDGLNTGSPLKKNYADESRGEIIVDGQSNVYVVSCTFSEDFPVTEHSFQPIFNQGKEGCVFKMDQNLSHLIWASYLGEAGDDACYSMDVAQDNSVYVCGGTTSTNFPSSPQVFQPQYGGGICDGFIAHISENGDQLLEFSYLGKADYDQSYLVKLSRNNHPYIFGQSVNNDNSWFINTQYGQIGGGQFIIHLTPQLDNAVWSTSYGTGNGLDISPTALLVDLCNTVYMSGWGSHSLNGFGGTEGLPLTQDAYQMTTDGSDYYFICLREDGNAPVYASFFGSAFSREHVDGGTSRFDKKGRIYQAICAGCGGDDNFPTTPGAWSEVNGSHNCNLGVVKMDFKLPLIIADFSAPNIICFPDSIHFVNNSQTQSADSHYLWNFGDGNTSTETSPSHLYTHGGIFHATLFISDTNSCNLIDSCSKDLLVLTGSTQTLENKSICKGNFTQIGIAPCSGADISYQWFPENSLSNPHISNPIAAPSTSTTYRLVISTPYCSDTLIQSVLVEDLQASNINDSTICLGDSMLLHFDIITGNVQHIIWSLSPDYSAPIATNTQTLLVHPTSSTHYYLKIEGVLCCIEQDILIDVSSVEISGTEPRKICFEDSIQLHIEVVGGNQFQYHWSPLDQISSQANTNHPWINPNVSVNYTVIVSNEFGCTASATIPVTKRTGTFSNGLEAWSDLYNIIEGASTNLFSTSYSGNYTYQWTPNSTLNTPNNSSTIAKPTETTTYTISVTDEFACTLSKEITIEVSPLICDEPLVFVPNTFTPNGDGKNDILYVRSSILKEFTLKIFNRWGEQIFESDKLEYGWDGSFKGKQCEQGVYDYYLIGTCINDEQIIKKGNITLIY